MLRSSLCLQLVFPFLDLLKRKQKIAFSICFQLPGHSFKLLVRAEALMKLAIFSFLFFLQVLYTCIKRNDKREVKVAQLAGSVAEHSAYHHGEASLMSTIINLAQDYVGSNNINLLQPIGQFGTRLQGGKDSASPRYIFTMLR